MRPYYIYSPPFDESSAGIVVMHSLAQQLKRAGCDVEVVSCEVKELTSKPWELDHASIAVYPEIIWGNPFCSHTVARLILHLPGFWGGPEDYPASNLLFVFHEMWNYKAKLHLPPGRLLQVPYLNLDRFINLHLPRKGRLVYRGKGTQPDDPTLIGIPLLGEKEGFRGKEGQDRLVQALNTCEVLYSYDNLTAMTEIARLCGCPVVFIPDPFFTREELEMTPVMQAGGVGYGLDETNKAISSMNSDHIHWMYGLQKIKFNRQLEQFITITQGGL